MISFSLNFCFREVYDSLDSESLLKVTIETGESSTLYCTAHGCQGQIATCYCVKCEDMLCTLHQQVYNPSTASLE